MTKFVKGLGLLMTFNLLADDVYLTSDFALAKNNRLMSEIETAKILNVQYRFVDLRLILYDSKRYEVACAYVLKSKLFSVFNGSVFL
ncbi:hypothetical protein ACFODO_09045 [Acinetobacter sichuanensis]|uniref:Uncharacterized protein n=1 Tax=Acinetobacter sichuanensis TaxID=2136183 RepID=A0A371YLP7_9GAMM|nr:hypothetical protein [Acinetobacter sichuanensis]RFC82407.1 hypothetical protein C9E89_016465 [Acinetobacter sichuanensis]